MTRTHALPFGYRVSFTGDFDAYAMRVAWAPELPFIRSKRAQRKFFREYAEARSAFLEQVASVTGQRMIADPAINRTETIVPPRVH